MNVFPGHGDLDSRLGGVHLLQDDAEVDGLVTGVTLPVNLAIQILWDKKSV